MLVLQATGDSAWLRIFGLCCLVVGLACLAHAPGACPGRQADGSGVWSLTLTLLAAYAGA